MSSIKKWIRTGERGAGAEITDSDILTTLLLLKRKPMGRYLLRREIGLSESSTKSLLNFCKKKGVLIITSNRSGHELSERGKQIVLLLEQIIIAHDVFTYRLFENDCQYFVFIRKATPQLGKKRKSSPVQPSWRIRDIAIAYGARAILLLQIAGNGKSLLFPEKELILSEYFPTLEEKILVEYSKEMQQSDFLLIVSAKTIPLARKSAIICALNFNTNIAREVQQLLN